MTPTSAQPGEVVRCHFCQAPMNEQPPGEGKAWACPECHDNYELDEAAIDELMAGVECEREAGQEELV